MKENRTRGESHRMVGGGATLGQGLRRASLGPWHLSKTCGKWADSGKRCFSWKKQECQVMGSWVDWGWALGGDCGSLSERGSWCNSNAFSESAGWVWGVLWPPSLDWGAFFVLLWWMAALEWDQETTGARGRGKTGDSGLDTLTLWWDRQERRDWSWAGAGWAHSLNSFVA